LMSPWQTRKSIYWKHGHWAIAQVDEKSNGLLTRPRRELHACGSDLQPT
jgi:hypothetical protein